MKKYETLKHISDLKIRSYGRTLPEVFSHMVLGMFESCRPHLTKKKVNRKIKIKSADRESLLLNFLSEVLALSDINQEIYRMVRFDQFGENYLEAELKGYKIESKELEIKAATWHNLKIEKKNNTWQATVLFDI